MKTIFDKAVRNELISRVSLLSENSKGNWGKMTVFEMTKHCTIWLEWIAGKNNPVYTQAWLGKIFGKMALRKNTKDDRPMEKGMPAGKEHTIKETGDVEQQKKIFITRINEMEYYSNPAFIHGFFGKMTTEQIGTFAYKHMDHHLRQFGV